MNFNFLGYFQIQNTGYKEQKITLWDIKRKIGNAINAKRNKNKLIIESINITKNIVLYSKHILLTREKM